MGVLGALRGSTRGGDGARRDALGTAGHSWTPRAEQQPSGFAGNKASTVPSQLRARRAVPSRQSAPLARGAGGRWSQGARRERAAPGASARRVELVRDALSLAFHLGPQHSLGAHHPATGSESQREVGELLALSTSRGVSVRQLLPPKSPECCR